MTKAQQTKAPKLPKNADRIAQAAPIAVSGVTGGEFWNEVNDRLNEAPEPKVEPRKLKP